MASHRAQVPCTRTHAHHHDLSSCFFFLVSAQREREMYCIERERQALISVREKGFVSLLCRTKGGSKTERKLNNRFVFALLSLSLSSLSLEQMTLECPFSSGRCFVLAKSSPFSLRFVFLFFPDLKTSAFSRGFCNIPVVLKYHDKMNWAHITSRIHHHN